ncbi:uncharacterized protein [Typha angustifolia]|uniref:uncharacterized protein isoform X2 n=1 Tax=Typha angustifolia TaxID=59011 RepID=UPI003C2B0A5B
MVGSRFWFGGLFNRSSNKRQGSGEKVLDFTPLQEQRLQRLKDRLSVPFDETRPDHQEALRALWHASFPDTELTSLVTEQWKDMGWQGPNPSTDFRGCGFVSLENLLFLARTYPASFQRLLFKQEGLRATWEYPFAVAGVNVSFMLIQMLELNSAKPKSLPGINFVKVLSDEEAFDVLYCIAFEMMDAQWLAMRASYMQFKVLSFALPVCLFLKQFKMFVLLFYFLSMTIPPGGLGSHKNPTRKRAVFGRRPSNSRSASLQSLVQIG